MKKSAGVYILGISCLLAACGGGGGGSTPFTPQGPKATATPTPTPIAYATLPPPSARAMDVQTLATGSGASQVAYVPDMNIVVLSAGNAVVDAANGTAFAAINNGTIGAVAYSSKDRSVVFAASDNNVYEQGLTGPLLTVSTNLSGISALTVAPDGTVYAVQSNRVIKIAGGVPSNITPAGAIGGCASYSVCPGIAFDSADNSLLVADPANDVVLHVTLSGTVTALAGSCKSNTDFGATGTGGSCWRFAYPGIGSAANFNYPDAIVYVPGTDTAYVADQGNSQIWSVSSNGAAAPVAGYGQPFNVDGNGLAAFLNGPTALAYQPQGNAIDLLESASSGQAVASLSLSGSAAAPYFAPAIPTILQGIMPSSLAGAPDGSVWVAQNSGHTIDHVTAPNAVTSVALPSDTTPNWHPTVDASGNAWFLAGRYSGISIPGGPVGPPVQDNGILEITANGTQNYIPVAAQHAGASSSMVGMQDVTIGPDGNPWFTESESSLYGGSFGTVNPQTLAVTQYPTSFVPQAIGTASSNRLAFFTSANGTPTMQFASTSGQLGTALPLTAFADISMAYRSSDQSSWFVDGSSQIVEVTAAGVEHDFRVCGGCDPVNLTIASDGSVWSDEGNGHAIARVTPGGQVVTYLLPEVLGATYGIAARSDGKLWVYNSIGALYLFDPAAYDAMGGPHPDVNARGASPFSTLHHWS